MRGSPREREGKEMKLFTGKKGFTIVELVIVIAVIAILAAVLIPTFNSVIAKANESAALQKAQTALQVATMEENGSITTDLYFVVDGYKYVFKYTAADGLKVDKTIEAKDVTATAYTAKAYNTTNDDLKNLKITVWTAGATTSSAT